MDVSPSFLEPFLWALPTRALDMSPVPRERHVQRAKLDKTPEEDAVRPSFDPRSQNQYTQTRRPTMTALTATFDSLSYVRKLEESGFTRQQAEVQAEALRQQTDVQAETLRQTEALREQLEAQRAALQRELERYDDASRRELATKGDVQDVRLEIEKVRAELKTDIEKVRYD